MIVPGLLCRWDGTLRAIAYSAFIAGSSWERDNTPAPRPCLLEADQQPPPGELPRRRPLPGTEATTDAWRALNGDQ